MRKSIVTLAVVCVCAWFANVMAQTPEYQPRPIADFVVRGGMGNAFAKLQAGEDVTVAYLGGSITAMNGWRNKTTDWLKSQFPNAKITEIHAAIGGTGSDLGVFRLGHDVLQFHPDLLFVEFAVNDGGADPISIWKQMEGIVRQTWKQNSRTDIVFTYTLHENMCDTIRKGEFPRSAGAMEALADFYNIPSINFQTRVVKMIDEGKAVFNGEAPEGVIVFSGDGCHPKDAGHELYLLDIQRALTAMRELPGLDHAPTLEHVFIAGNLENAKFVPIRESMLTGNWARVQEGEPMFGFNNRLGDVWHADAPGSKISFKFKGSVCKVYDILGPNAGQVRVTVDGKTSNPIPRFDSYCSWFRLATLWVGANLDPEQVHEVTIEIDSEQPCRDAVPESKEKPEKYDGTHYWTGQIMMVGDLVD